MLSIYRRHLMAVIIKMAPSMADTSATTTNMGIQVFSLLGSETSGKRFFISATTHLHKKD